MSDLRGDVMGSISTGMSALPGASAQGTATALPQPAVDHLRVQGVPESAIAAANSAVANVSSVANGQFYPQAPRGTAPAADPTAEQTTGTAAVDTSGLDQPDPQFPGMLKSHVLVFRATGTPDSKIAEFSAMHLNYGEIDQWLQAHLMQNPEGWDAYLDNPAGTARAGLQQLMPDVQLPPPGQGNPGTVPDWNVNVPSGAGSGGIGTLGSSAPSYAPTPGFGGAGGNGLLQAGLVAAALAGVGLLVWKMRSGNSVKDVEQAANLAMRAIDVGGDDAVRMTPDVMRAMAARGVARGASRGVAGLHAMSHGYPPGLERALLAMNAGVPHDVPALTMLRYDILARAADTGQLRYLVGDGATTGAARLVDDALTGARALI